MEISTLTQPEISDAANIIQAVFGNHGEKAAEEFSRLFKGEAHPTYVFLAKKDSVTVGMAACVETYFSFDVHAICWVAVLPEYRRQGICAAMISHTENFIQHELLSGKKGTIILAADITDYYTKLGYAKQTHPLHDGAFIMSKIVNGST